MTTALTTWPPVRDVPDATAAAFDPEARVARESARVLAETGRRDPERQAAAERARRRQLRRERGVKPIGTPVRCVETGKTFPAVTDAAEACGLARTTCWESVRTGGQTLGLVDGERRWLHFERVDGAGEPSAIRPRNRPVVCVDTATRYGSLAEAAGGRDVAEGKRRARQLSEAIRLGHRWEGKRWGFAER